MQTNAKRSTLPLNLSFWSLHAAMLTNLCNLASYLNLLTIYTVVYEIRKHMIVFTFIIFNPLVSHSTAVTSCGYNQTFSQVVTADDSGIIKVWDLETGRKTFEFSANVPVRLFMIPLRVQSDKYLQNFNGQPTLSHLSSI